MTDNFVYLFIYKLIIQSHTICLDCIFYIRWPVKGRVTQLFITGFKMDSADAAMKQTRIILMSSLFGIFLGIITLVNYIAYLQVANKTCKTPVIEASRVYAL